MFVECTGYRELPPDFTEQSAGAAFEPYTIVNNTKITTTKLGKACGHMIEVYIDEGDPGLPTTWDVKTDSSGRVIERHKDVKCPLCDTNTFIVEAT